MPPDLQKQPRTRVAIERPETVLVVDDSRVQRRILTSHLARWGFCVIEAGSAEDALEMCRAELPDMVVSDWVMPGMGGLEFCRAFRAMQADRYGYFILLTSKSEKSEIAEGLNVGADDFLTKPVNAYELRARIRAGQRILKVERELTEKNRLISSTLAEVEGLYRALDRDLVEARRFQFSLVRDNIQSYDTADVALMLQPSGHVGGDMVGAFPVGEGTLGLFALDVSGHGIASALITAQLAAFFSSPVPGQNVAISKGHGGSPTMNPPSEVARALNKRMLCEMRMEHYSTLLLAGLDLQSGKVTMTQAGHPYPALLRRSGEVEFLGAGGLPIGLVDSARYVDVEAIMAPGDRLFIGSDGITECVGAEGTMLEEEGLARLLSRNAVLDSRSLLDAVRWELEAFVGGGDFDDDVSAILVDYKGPDAKN